MNTEEKLNNLFNEINKDHNNNLHKLSFILGILTRITIELTIEDMDEIYEEIAKIAKKEGAK